MKEATDNSLRFGLFIASFLYSLLYLSFNLGILVVGFDQTGFGGFFNAFF